MEVSEFLRKHFFTTYLVKEKLIFNNSNLGENPIYTETVFLDQFSLSLNRYRDRNIFLKKHWVQTSDSRFTWEGSDYFFTDFEQNSAWEHVI